MQELDVKNFELQKLQDSETLRHNTWLSDFTKAVENHTNLMSSVKNLFNEVNKNEDIKNICNKFKNLDINYINNKTYLGNSSVNLNNAIINTKYSIIKFLMQDEYLYDSDILLKINESFKDKKINWVVNGQIGRAHV